MRGSFNPKLPKISRRSPITAYSDRTLDIKTSWLDDSEPARELRRSLEKAFVEMGLADSKEILEKPSLSIETDLERGMLPRMRLPRIPPAVSRKLGFYVYL